jgi:N-methylhydantoinase B
MSRRPLQVYRELFASVTDEMGQALRDSARSPNIKERLDFSCALLDAEGRLVAHAAFIPVHLGSAHLTLPAVLAERHIAADEVVVLNDPHRGGTHLNDITVLAPVEQDGRRLGYLLNRAHHADVGGAAPGSMGGAQDIHGEGLRLPPTTLMKDGVRIAEIWALLAANVRDPEATVTDLAAQLAALARGRERLGHLLARHGASELAQAMEELHDYGARFTRRLLGGWPQGAVEVEDRLDGEDSARLALRLQRRGDGLLLDFSGSEAQVPGGWNTHRAVATSAVFHLLQSLGEGALPETSGALEPLEIRLPAGSLLDSRAPAGVALGNVETSQRVVDLLLQALDRLMPGAFPAPSQGSMNNLLYGGFDREGRPFVNYETLGGGAGAGPSGPGADAVQVHMTNTRNTPVEVLEAEQPVQVLRLALRRGSGGQGRYRGGCGLIKEVRFLEAVTLTVAGTRRESASPGVHGGGAGQSGRDRVCREGRWRRLACGVPLRLEAGDRVEVATPGGGGFGRP